jgi:hypothetical protein
MQGDLKMAELQAEAQAKQQDTALKVAADARDHYAKTAGDAADAAADEKTRDLQAQIAGLESSDRAAERASKERIAEMEETTERMRLESEMLQHPEATPLLPSTPFDVPA